ncbi:MAG: sensor histidine kinase [Schwartzia sp. (in: firmicutes)]
MDIINLLPLVITLNQWGDAYLRYLPFAQRLSAERRRLLFQSLLLWGIIDLLIKTYLFHVLGLSIPTYKLVLSVVWFPYFLISLYVIRHQFPQQIFIGGMQALWAFCLHTIGNSAMWMFFTPDAGLSLIAHQALFFLLCFLITLPLSHHIFRNLMPSRRLINELPFGYYIAFLPFTICLAMLPMFLVNAFPSLKNAPLRLFLPIIFFLLYRYTVLERENQKAQAKQANDNKLMAQQLRALQDYTLLMEESQSELKVLRHDMRHNIRLLYALTEEKKPEEVLRLLTTLDADLKQTAIRPLCPNPILNAALSIYLGKANNLQIPVTVKVNLPPQLPGYENDFAIVLSNLIENAILASLKQPPHRRAIDLSLQYKNEQVALSLKNRSDAPLSLGKNGLPQAAEEGHGIGMISLAEFSERHNAYVEYTQEDGWVTCLLYWSMATR